MLRPSITLNVALPKAVSQMKNNYKNPKVPSKNNLKKGNLQRSQTNGKFILKQSSNPFPSP
jgi:hypothetical protein